MSPEPPMLAGQAGGLARPVPAGDLVGILVRETDQAVTQLST
jgi:hypothetical protein